MTKTTPSHRTTAFLAGCLVAFATVPMLTAAGSAEDPEIADETFDYEFMPVGLEDLPADLPPAVAGVLAEQAAHAGLLDVTSAYIACETGTSFCAHVTVADIPDDLKQFSGQGGVFDASFIPSDDVIELWESADLQDKVRIHVFFDVKGIDYRLTIYAAKANLRDLQDAVGADVPTLLHQKLTAALNLARQLPSVIQNPQPISAAFNLAWMTADGDGVINRKAAVISLIDLVAPRILSAKGTVDSLDLPVPAPLTEAAILEQLQTAYDEVMMARAHVNTLPNPDAAAAARAALMEARQDIVTTNNSMVPGVYDTAFWAAIKGIDLAVGQLDSISDNEQEIQGIANPLHVGQLRAYAFAQANYHFVQAAQIAETLAGLPLRAQIAGHVQTAVTQLNIAENLMEQIDPDEDPADPGDPLGGAPDKMLFATATLDKRQNNAWQSVATDMLPTIDFEANSFDVSVGKALVGSPRAADDDRLTEFFLKSMLDEQVVDEAPNSEGTGQAYGRDYAFQVDPGPPPACDPATDEDCVVPLVVAAVGSSSADIRPGGMVAYTFRIQNPNRISLTCSVHAAGGLPPGWQHELDASTCSLAPQGSSVFALTVRAFEGAQGEFTSRVFVEEDGSSAPPQEITFRTRLDPQSEDGGPGGNNKKNGGGSPGFEAFAVVVALAALLGATRRRLK